MIIRALDEEIEPLFYRTVIQHWGHTVNDRAFEQQPWHCGTQRNNEKINRRN
jgi:hypothetical protein